MQELQTRISDFAIKTIKAVRPIYNHFEGKHLHPQIVRSVSSVSLNYSESLACESRKDFAHKVSIALKELRETECNLKIITGLEIIEEDTLSPVLKEADELAAILYTSIRTARENIEKKKT